jgi:hypothetical protein
MRTLGPAFRAVNERILQYYSRLLKQAPRGLAEELLGQIEQRHRRQGAPKIDRICPGGPPRVRMPTKQKPGDEPSG